MSDSERDAVRAWLVGALGWRAAGIEAKPKGRSVFIFHEDAGGGCHYVHRFRADQLRWRYVRNLGFAHVPELTAKVEAIWQEYLGHRLAAALPTPTTGDSDE